MSEQTSDSFGAFLRAVRSGYRGAAADPGVARAEDAVFRLALQVLSTSGRMPVQQLQQATGADFTHFVTTLTTLLDDGLVSVAGDDDETAVELTPKGLAIASVA